MQTEQSAEATVFVVDDDEVLCKAICELLRISGFKVESYHDARAFLAAQESDRPGCLVADLRMPEMNGLELQERLGPEGIDIPLILITGHGDVSTAVKAMKNGAVDFLEKPFSDEALLRSVRGALAKDARTRRNAAAFADIVKRRERLTPRERQVMDLIVVGHSSRSIADSLNISPRTAEKHRARIMEKMKAKNLSELIRWALADPSTEVDPAG